MSGEKRETRRRFREAVFRRDRYSCAVCGHRSSAERVEQELDAHHVWPREQMPGGGYVPANGVSLCDHVKRGVAQEGCHARAEKLLARFFQEGIPFPKTGEPEYEFSPEALYSKITSSYELAVVRSSARFGSSEQELDKSQRGLGTCEDMLNTFLVSRP